jgi:hypothetical protein
MSGANIETSALFRLKCTKILQSKIYVNKATFSNISVISWWLVLLVEETGVPGENY